MRLVDLFADEAEAGQDFIHADAEAFRDGVGEMVETMDLTTKPSFGSRPCSLSFISL